MKTAKNADIFQRVLSRCSREVCEPEEQLARPLSLPRVAGKGRFPWLKESTASASKDDTGILGSSDGEKCFETLRVWLSPCEPVLTDLPPATLSYQVKQRTEEQQNSMGRRVEPSDLRKPQPK